MWRRRLRQQDAATAMPPHALVAEGHTRMSRKTKQGVVPPPRKRPNVEENARLGHFNESFEASEIAPKNDIWDSGTLNVDRGALRRTFLSDGPPSP